MSINVTIDGTKYTGVDQVDVGGKSLHLESDAVAPSGSVTITENGTHDVTNYAQAVVNVESGGEGGDRLVAMVDGSLSGVVSLPESVKSLREHLFEGTNISGIEMPGVTEIKGYAFYNCKSLALTELPQTLETIGMWAFAGCGNIKISRIPASVKNLSASYIFYQTNIKELTFEGKPDAISASSLNGVATVNVPWAEGEVANAPWGATTVNYNYTGA